MSNRPVMSVTYKRGDTNYSVLSIWPGKFAGTYSVSRDKGSEKYPAISIIDVLKSWAGGDGFINVRVTSEADAGRDYAPAPGRAPNSFADDGFGDDDAPF